MILIVLIFCIVRPISTISFFVNYNLGGVTINEIVSIGSSYLFLVLALVNIKKIKFDVITLMLFSFVAYVSLSITWGGNVRDAVKLILPFTVYFAARGTIVSEKNIEKIYLCLASGFIIPVVMSTIKTIRGNGVEMVIFETGLARYMGVFTGPHAIAHSMFICLFAIVIYHYFIKYKDEQSNAILIALSVLGLLATYNIYKSYTRNVYVAIVSFLFIYLLGMKKYKLLGLLSFVLAVVVVFSSSFHTIFFDVVNPLMGKTAGISEMGSGRIGGWSSMLSSFFDSPLVDQIRGLGMSAQTTITSGKHFGGAHNDLLSVLLCFGYIGIFIYLTLYVSIFLKVIFADVDRGYKVIMVGFLVAVACMNLLSNSYLTRFELAQYFNLSLGAFFGLDDAVRMRNLELAQS